MSIRRVPDGAADQGLAPGRRVRRLARGVTATWWYTVGAVVIFEVTLVLAATGTLLTLGLERWRLITVLISGLLWCAASLALLVQYRRRDDGLVRELVLPLVVAVVAGAVAGIVSGWWSIGALPIVQSLVLVSWPRGIRLRVLVAGTALLALACFLDTRSPAVAAVDAVPSLTVVVLFTVTLPALSVSTLWWWDVLDSLDHARAAEARLGAAQERLRIAADVHDLQGHHLQVIALQVELSERLIDSDPESARAHLAAARESVEAAGQGTRDLATRFRGVPLPDEIANAVDLLEAAGMPATAQVADGSAGAPSAVLGPVIRETTTNILRYGDGGPVRFALTPINGAWRYEVANTTSSQARIGTEGTGLRGLGSRLDEAGGRLEIRKTRQTFTVIAEVPDGAGEER